MQIETTASLGIGLPALQPGDIELAHPPELIRARIALAG